MVAGLAPLLVREVVDRVVAGADSGRAVNVTPFVVALVAAGALRFGAGFAHESQSLEQQREVLGVVEEHLRRTVVVSSACGLGRRSEEAGRDVLERTAELCAGD